MGPSRLLPIAVLALLLLGAGLHIVAGNSSAGPSSIHAQGVDDAFISYRYAQNLVAGHGLVFNPGERVEGYTNPLTVLLAALCLGFSHPDQVYWLISAFNLVVVLGAAVMFSGGLKSQLGTRAAGSAALLLGLCPLIWAWTASGIETVQVTALQIALWRLSQRRETSLPLLGLVFSLCILVRADGFLFPGTLLAFYLVNRQYRAVALGAGVLGTLMIGRFSCSLAYYGDLLPNTYYAKVSGPLADRLLHAVRQLIELSWAKGFALYLVALLILLACELRAAKRNVLPEGGKRNISFPPLFSCIMLAYWLYIGGDHFGERFLLFLFPMGIVAMFQLLSNGFFRSRAMAAAILLSALALQLSPLVRDARFAYVTDRYDFPIALGRYLGQHHPGEVLAAGAAGKVAYFSGLRTIDMRGLTDKHIGRLEITDFTNPGHDKIDPEYVLAREPDLIAGWLTPSFDMNMGMHKERYERAGYRLKLIVNASRVGRETDVVDVTNLERGEILRLHRLGYRFAVLAKEPSTRGALQGL